VGETAKVKRSRFAQLIACQAQVRAGSGSLERCVAVGTRGRLREQSVLRPPFFVWGKNGPGKDLLPLIEYAFVPDVALLVVK
jgi:hypothetical protein